MLRRGTKAGYGSADLGLSGGELLLQLYLLEYYIRVVGLSPWLVGVALALGVFWDAVTDPLMGGIVDRFRSRWGRFSPFLFVGAVLFGLGLALLFNPPAMDGQLAMFVYLLFSYIFTNTGLTIVGVPHIALGGVLSTDTHERTELYGWRLAFGTVGLFVGILIPLLAAQLLSADVTSRNGLAASRALGSLLMGALVVGSVLITIVAIRPREKRLPAPEIAFTWRDFGGDLLSVTRNPVFLPFLVAFILVAMGRTLNSTLALPYYKDSLRLPEAVVQSQILGVFTLCIVLSVPLWTWLGRRYGKRNPAFAGMFTLGIMSMIAYPLFPQGTVAGPVFAAIIGGFAVGAIILVESLLTDVADEDTVRNGRDREGLYFGYWRMAQKLARSLTLGLSGLLLTWIGYEEALLQQAPETERRLAWVFGLGVGGLFTLASLLFLRTPIDRARQESIQCQKAARASEQKP